MTEAESRANSRNTSHAFFSYGNIEEPDIVYTGNCKFLCKMT